jgi:carboxypeptidase C (cathepsin A)
MNGKIGLFVVVLLALYVSALAKPVGKRISDLPFGENFKNTPLDVIQHSGYIEVNQQHNANLFYWCFESQNDPSTDPVIFWLTGGPGCSSQLALLFENGPFTVSSSETLVPNPSSWNNKATVCWIDQPAGTGYSYANTDYISNEAGVQIEMWAFIQGFFSQYPQYATQDFYLTGESYGGHYVPAISSYIVQQISSGSQSVNFKGCAVGNGWVAPIIQYGQYGSFAYANNLITTKIWDQMNRTYEQCLSDLQSGQYNYNAFETCEGIMQYVLNANPGLNYYNIKAPCVGSLCYNFDTITKYLNMASTKNTLGVPSKVTWAACNNAGTPFIPVDEVTSYASDIPVVLEAGYKVMIYSGMLDLICNYMGGAAWLESISWPGASGFNGLQLQDWNVGGSVAGHYKTYNNLTFVEVEEAGHMVPHDQPANALVLINTFLGAGF